MSDAEWSREFVSALADFSAVLSKSNIAIYGIDYSFEAFGCWTLEIGNRHNRLRLGWDGRESTLACSSSSVADSRATKEWNLVAEEKVPNGSSSEVILSAAKKFVSHLEAT